MCYHYYMKDIIDVLLKVCLKVLISLTPPPHTHIYWSQYSYQGQLSAKGDLVLIVSGH